MRAFKLRAMALLAAGLALAGCGRPPEQGKPVTTVAASPAVRPVFTVNELMVMVVDRPGERLWDVEKPGKAPKSGEDWYDLESHAVEVASAGTLIQLGGTGPLDAQWAAKPAWQSAAQALINAALAARTAAGKKDLPALVAANGQIVEACEGCHKQFKPDLPTGGLFMHHAPAANPET